MRMIHVLPRRLREFLLTHPLYKSPSAMGEQPLEGAVFDSQFCLARCAMLLVRDPHLRLFFALPSLKDDWVARKQSSVFPGMPTVALAKVGRGHCLRLRFAPNCCLYATWEGSGSTLAPLGWGGEANLNGIVRIAIPGYAWVGEGGILSSAR